jgi:hypothetical protein
MSRLHKLRYDWLTPINRLHFEPQPYSVFHLTPIIEFADWFVDTWADMAELAKMQPVHLLRNDLKCPAKRGIAWRFEPNMDVLCFPRERHMVAESVHPDNSSILFVYEFHKDGSVTHVFGEKRAEILGAQLERQNQEPLTVRARQC